MSGLYEKIRESNPEFLKFLWKNKEPGNRYQEELYQFIKFLRPDIVVETGIQCAVSTDSILRAMDEVEVGRLYSFDPSPFDGLEGAPDKISYLVGHPRWTPIFKTSYDGMAELYCETGPWGVFLHDSDHEVHCQTFEYNLAFQLVKSTGWILSDDYTWGTPMHGAWGAFLKRYELKISPNLGHCARVRKPIIKTPTNDHVPNLVTQAKVLADEALAKYKELKTCPK